MTIEQARQLLAAGTLEAANTASVQALQSSYLATFLDATALCADLGFERGSQVIASLEYASANAELPASIRTQCRGVLSMLSSRGIDMAYEPARTQVTGFAALGLITSEEVTILLARGASTVPSPASTILGRSATQEDWDAATAVAARADALDSLERAVMGAAAAAMNEWIHPARSNPELPLPTAEQINGTLHLV